MDIGSILLILALLVLVALFVSRPFFEQRQKVFSPHLLSDQADHELSALLAERDRILNALQELDFDHALGKIPSEDYPVQRAILLQQGADTLRQLDGLQAETPAEAAEERLEAVIAARRADARQVAAGRGAGRNGGEAAPSLGRADDDIETLLANRRRARQEKAAGFCAQCGGPLQKSDRFCPKCGASV